MKTRYYSLLCFFVFLIESSLFGSVAKTSSVTFAKNAFHSTHYLYLGASSTGGKKEALSRAYLAIDLTTEPNTTICKLQELSPETAYINRENDKQTKSANPIYDASIAHLSLIGQSPVVSLGTRNPAYTDAATTGANQTLCLVSDFLEGTIVNVNIERLKDANNSDTGGIAGLAGSASHIFAAVNKTGETFFGTGDSGIAVVKSDGTKLSPVDATSGDAGNKAVDVKNAASATPTQITLNDQITMYWDSFLQRLFVGLRGKINSTSSTFFSGVLVGRMDETKTSKLTLEPIIPSTVIGTNEDTDKIVVFYKDTILPPNDYVSIENIKTMHTSTGKSYIIVNGNIYNDLGSIVKTEVHALPIVRKQYSANTITAANIGKLAKSSATETTQENIVEVIGDLKKSIDLPTHVGGGTQGGSVNDTPANVNDIFVVGDSVFVCCDGTTSNLKGIYQSTAIFDKDGLIRAWTPWQRAMGSTDGVRGGGMDQASGEFWYLTRSTPGETMNTARITQWDTKDTNRLGNLRDKLATEFTQENAGVHQSFNFDEKTPGFLASSFSMMIATGNQKVALIQTGKLDTGNFVPTLGDDFNATNIGTYAKFFSDTIIQDLGPICCAEVSRSTTDDDGWIFVGGYNGVAVLRQNLASGNDGDGWTNLSNLTTNLTNYSFKKIGTFTHVHKLVCDGTYLYVLTPSALYRIAMSAAKFRDASPTALDAQIIAQPSYANLTNCTTNDALLDFIVSQKLGLLATTGGFYRTSNTKDITSGTIADARDWTEIITPQNPTLGPVTHLHPISTAKGSPINDGNLWIVAGNMSTDLTTLFRFTIGNTNAIDDDIIKPIKEAKASATDSDRDDFYNIGEFRTTFVTDGSLGFHTLSKHFGRTNYLRKINFYPNQTNVRMNDTPIAIDPGTNAYNIGIPVKNTASGAWIAPGDWGIRINE